MKSFIKSVTFTDKDLNYLSEAFIFLERSYNQLLIDNPEEFSEIRIESICKDIRKLSGFVDLLIEYGQLHVSLENDSDYPF